MLDSVEEAITLDSVEMPVWALRPTGIIIPLIPTRTPTRGKDKAKFPAEYGAVRAEILSRLQDKAKFQPWNLVWLLNLR
ncbi:hypothetical protein SADUNF_Sadunf11G0013500 [Salix dunnii]|uniref:Uncharacterized protein n=1 Tax=Salix dunnii TaxID=1413687 RepID=A0A835JMK0_9ROSI|nr:hypothetical protein SADUNF_Sadunf11G0013500 [Salix dunnii]